ncbi:alpha/beta fold hydrolase [Pseudalkalibacillus decolorationis]|uniref:alpha/beta fold hydrolase n=1 Tax=Pseudalkalibacillus decolorationis TaxID=163879 RepID=UPI002147A72D|nr:alpha/beta hydrolase [Pseudalkalibacillus decolorationis]
MKRYFVQHGEMDVHITEWGDKNSPTIFCLHGLGSTSFSFIEIAESLQDMYRFISIDAPGHGKTAPFQDPRSYEMPKLAFWIDQLVNILKIDRFYFLSHSWGSFVTMFYLLEYHERVIGTILIDGGYQTKRQMDQSLEEEIEYYEKDFEGYVFDTWSEYLEAEKEAYTRWSPLIEVAVKDLAFEKDNKIIWHVRGSTAKSIIQAMHKHETEDIYENLPSNIILLSAGLPYKNGSYYEETTEFFKERTNSVVKIIDNTTHMLHWDSPQTVIEGIKNNWG